MSLAPRTLDAYRADWADFERWCAEHGHVSLPATDTAIVDYVDALATTRRPSTVQRRLAAIRAAHADAGLPSATDHPTVAAAMSRTRWRRRDVVTSTVPVTVAAMRAMSRALPDTTAGVRDRAVLLVGYGAALRPSELVGLGSADVSMTRVGLRVTTTRGRVTVPFGSAVELCAVTAWTRWCEHSGIVSGAAFRPVDRSGRVGDRALSEKAVGRIVRRAAEAAGLDASRYTGLSLRRGMVAAAADAGASRRTIMRQTGHRSDRLVRDYVTRVSTA